VKHAYRVKVSHVSGTREFLVDASRFSVAVNRAVANDDRFGQGHMDESILVHARKVPPPLVPLKDKEVRLVSDMRMRGQSASIGTGLAG
jgi:hypothetical protein